MHCVNARSARSHLEVLAPGYTFRTVVKVGGGGAKTPCKPTPTPCTLVQSTPDHHLCAVLIPPRPLPLSPLDHLRRTITEQLGRGPADRWTDYDYDYLSDDLFERTGTRLSVTTLKRLYGRIKYTSNPSTTTLNALARYAGFADWRAYEAEVPSAEAGVPAPEASEDVSPAVTPESSPGSSSIPPAPAAAPSLKRYLTQGILTLVLAALIGTLLAFLHPDEPLPPDPADFAFTSRKVKTEGVPNTVVFTYAATAAGDRPVRISQSWDTARSVVVDYRDSVFSSQYYLPGWFNAKLLVGEHVVRHHDLYITAPDWVATIDRAGRPIYLEEAEYLDQDTLVVSENLLRNYNVTLEPDPPAIEFRKVPDLPEIRTDDFRFATTLRSDYNRGSGACQALEVLLLCKNDAIIVPLRAAGCTGDARLYALGSAHPATTSDLSGFGTDLSHWTRLEITGRDRQLVFRVNDNEALSVTTAVDPREIVGVAIRAWGPARVGDTSLEGGGYVISF